MEGDRFFYLMVVVIALIGVGLFAIPVRAYGNFPLAESKPPAIHWLRILSRLRILAHSCRILVPASMTCAAYSLGVPWARSLNLAHRNVQDCLAEAAIARMDGRIH